MISMGPSLEQLVELRCLHCGGPVDAALFEGTVPLDAVCAGQCRTRFDYAEFIDTHRRQRTRPPPRRQLAIQRPRPPWTPTEAA